MCCLFSVSDFDAVLKLEPGNKQAKLDVIKLEKVSINLKLLSFTDTVLC